MIDTDHLYELGFKHHFLKMGLYQWKNLDVTNYYYIFKLRLKILQGCVATFIILVEYKN